MANKFKTFKCYQHFSDNLEADVKNLDDRKILINLLMEGSGSEQERDYAEIYYKNNYSKPVKKPELIQGTLFPEQITRVIKKK